MGGNIIVNNASTIPPLNFGMVLDSTTFVLDNNSDNLLADGIVILNNTGEYPSVKWLVKIIPNKKYGKFYWVSDTRK